ncbi:MAG TPA: hypothetical protein VGT02_08345 [Methylomirabilota bacterium]|jgi:hypothetical protein|nr:hypothetical protein [Methylomirabilota bacterium]
MAEERTLEGWDPGPLDGAALAEAVERAFDYRGDVTLVRRDGGELVGYLFNRNADVATPYVQVYALDGGEPVTIPYADLRSIRFTGRDTAAGNSYAAWLRSREAAKAAGSARGA